MKSFASAAIFIAIMFFIGFVSTWIAPVGVWYDGIEKSALTPPGWVFPIAWTILYVLIGIAGSLVWALGEKGLLFKLWATQALLNGMWSIAFFKFHMPILALAIILTLLFVILMFIKASWNKQKMAAYLFLPYAIWVGFASYLNATVAWLN